MPAFCSSFAEAVFKIKQFSECRTAADIHNAFVVFGPLRGIAIWAVRLQLMGKIPACNKYSPSPGLLHSFFDDLSEFVVFRERKPGQPDADQLEIRTDLPDKPERNHRSVVKSTVTLAVGSCREVLLLSDVFYGRNKISIIILPKGYLRSMKTPERAFSLGSR